MTLQYILDDNGNPQPEPDLLKWGRAFGDKDSRKVARETIGDADISTVFLGIDHGWSEKPILWETMVFGGSLNGEQDRCGGNREDALMMHARMVVRVRESQK